MKKIRIATRKSALALWQANYVGSQLKRLYPSIEVSLVERVSQGDRILGTSLAKIGGKGLFVKELENALLHDEADIAVHSMKDVPMILPERMALPVICQRENPQDAFVSLHYADFASLPLHAIVGTSSLRRQCQLLAIRPDLQIKVLRGNVNTRLARLDAGHYDAIILAVAGLKRLGLGHRIREALPVEVSLPAAGQGAIGIETCQDRHDVMEMIKPLHHHESALCVSAEREVSRHLNASCHMPVASYATISKDTLNLRALIGSPDAGKILRAETDTSPKAGVAAAKKVVKMLVDQGAEQIIADISAE